MTVMVAVSPIYTRAGLTICALFVCFLEDYRKAVREKAKKGFARLNYCEAVSLNVRY